MYTQQALEKIGAMKVSALTYALQWRIGLWHSDLCFEDEVLLLLESNIYITARCIKIVKDGGFGILVSKAKPIFENQS